MSILTVGAGGTYATLAKAIAASHDGDVLRVAAGIHTNDFAAIYTKITIQGVGGMVRLVASVPPNGASRHVYNEASSSTAAPPPARRSGSPVPEP